MKNYNKLIKNIWNIKIMNNSLSTSKHPCQTQNLYTTLKWEKLFFRPADDYALTLLTLKWRLQFLLGKKKNQPTNKSK